MDDGMIRGIYLFKKTDLKFRGTFHNKFYYIMSNYLYFSPDLIETTRKFVNGEDYGNAHINLEVLIKSRLERHQLFTIIDENIKKGEFVEIYNEWLNESWKYTWGPPKETIELSLSDVLSERKFNLSGSEWKKYIIYKCGELNESIFFYFLPKRA